MAANWLAFGLGQTVVAASGVLPASMIAVMAGATLGFGRGLALSMLATMLGGWLAFTVSRSALGGWIGRRLEKRPGLARIDAAIAGEGWRMVALLRVSPVMPFALTSYALGLTRISHRDFLLGTLASLPALAGYVALGALGKQGLLMADRGLTVSHVALLALGFAVVGYALWRLRKGLAAAIAVPLPPPHPA
ncbi:MAG: VTT domain-containing protein [Sphingomonadales bacterium]|nr:VTT domain-containing protein [Sphingomonadales bacterium]